ncbi:hypothetical protein GQ44DRAFT_413693 [Phaeosphaeriaceae sp. PMI808]|nr:hypothetical protein GQ44DRAFT_413693 [Phaeosphaeriaceae sp. PMI808]
MADGSRVRLSLGESYGVSRSDMPGRPLVPIKTSRDPAANDSDFLCCACIHYVKPLAYELMLQWAAGISWTMKGLGKISFHFIVGTFVWLDTQCRRPSRRVPGVIHEKSTPAWAQTGGLRAETKASCAPRWDLLRIECPRRYPACGISCLGWITHAACASVDPPIVCLWTQCSALCVQCGGEELETAKDSC